MKRSTLLVLMSALVLFSYYVFSTSTQYSTAYWQTQIERNGAEQAYTELRSASIPTEARHRIEHAFGAALFEMTFHTNGFEGYTVCSNVSANGCLHEYIGHAIAERGLSSLPEIGSVCTKSKTGVSNCFHSIGHGLIAHFGYGTSTLPKALELCHSINQQTSAQDECIDGTFMEFNEHNMTSSDHEYRKVSEKELEHPCGFSSLIDQYGCLRRFPTLARETVFYGEILPQMTEHFKTLCSQFPDRSWARSGCYRGIGEALIRTSNFDPQLLAHACDLTSSTTIDTVVCRAGATAYHRGLYRLQSERDTTVQTCSSLPSHYLALCVQFARGVLSAQELQNQLLK